MGSNFHYTIDLNEDQNHQYFFSPLGSSLHHHQHLHQGPSNPLSSNSPSLSCFPFLINSHQDQVNLGYNNNTIDGFLYPHLYQPLETKKYVSNGGASSSDQMVPKKETRLKLTIRKEDFRHDPIDLPHSTKNKETISHKWISSKVRLIKDKPMTTTNNNKEKGEQSSNLSNLEGDRHDHAKKLSKNQFKIIVNKNGYNGSNNSIIRVCSDCNTNKTPLWRSGPRGPKSLCNACGIRQRKARRAAMAATADVSQPFQNKKKRSIGVCKLSSPSAPIVKKRLITLKEATPAEDKSASKSTTFSSSSTFSSSNKNFFDDLEIILRKSSAYQQVFPQDEKEAAILLMALSYGMVHG